MRFINRVTDTTRARTMSLTHNFVVPMMGSLFMLFASLIRGFLGRIMKRAFIDD